MRCSRASRARQAALPSALLSTSGVVSGVDVCRIASHPWPLPVSRNRLDPCFQRALGDLSLFFCLFFFLSQPALCRVWQKRQGVRKNMALENDFNQAAFRRNGGRRRGALLSSASGDWEKHSVRFLLSDPGSAVEGLSFAQAAKVTAKWFLLNSGMIHKSPTAV